MIFNRTIVSPASPKLSISPSTHPVRQRALLTIFARKNNVPIDPPSSGPNVLLIMTVSNHKEIIITQCQMEYKSY